MHNTYIYICYFLPLLKRKIYVARNEQLVGIGQDRLSSERHPHQTEYDLRRTGRHE